MRALFRRFVAGRRVRCPVCRYDLADAPEARCPECGEALELFAHHAVGPHLVRMTIPASLLVAMLVAVLILGIEYTDPVSQRRPSRTRPWVWGAAIGCAVAAALTAWGLHADGQRRARKRRAAAPDEECRILGVLTGGLGVRCPVRGGRAGDTDRKACPECGDRLSVRIRPVSPMSLKDRRSVWLTGSLSMLALSALYAGAGITFATWRWQYMKRLALPGLEPPWSGERLEAFWFAMAVVVCNVTAMTVIWTRRRWLIRSKRHALRVIAPSATMLQLFVLYVLLHV